MNQPVRVLLVEDDHDLAEFAQRVLSRQVGVAVDVITDGESALQAVRRGVADILITDIELPGLSGLDLAAEARRCDPAMPVTVMTAHASVDYAVTALRSQVDEFLVKPVSVSQFGTTLRTLIKLRKERDASAAGQTVLAIGAHPDDVEIGVGGILAAHRAAGDAVIILTLSRGARGGDTLARQQESLAAAELIGARLFLEDLHDTAISPADPTVGIIERVVAEVRPTVVYTHSPHDRHQDHRAVHQAASVATRSVAAFACFQSPSATVQFQPNRFVPIDDHLDTKLELLACFASQSGIRDYMQPDFVAATARYWSRFGGGTSCEPLDVIRDTRVVGTAGAVVSAAGFSEARQHQIARRLESP